MFIFYSAIKKVCDLVYSKLAVVQKPVSDGIGAAPHIKQNIELCFICIIFSAALPYLFHQQLFASGMCGEKKEFGPSVCFNAF